MALDHPDLSMMNPGKKDTVYVRKVDRERRYEPNRYLSWPIRDILNILDMSHAEESYVQAFDDKLSMRMLHQFLNENKQYIYNKRIPHNTYLCQICENTVLLSKGISRVFSSNIPTDPHTIADHYSCDSDAAESMLGQCNECDDHGLKPEDFEKTLSAGHSDSDSEEREFDRTVGFYEWKRGDNGYMMKSQVTLSIEDALTLWNSKVQRLKEHVFTKRQQQSKISYLKANIKVNEVLIHLDYSENYKSQDQNEIQSAYFGQASFSLFTACPYYRCSKTNDIKTMPTAITSEVSGKSQMASITCVKKVINHVLSKIVNKIDMVYIVSDGCASQFRSKFVFKLLTLIHPEIGLEWHYNKFHHGKGPMDGI